MPTIHDQIDYLSGFMLPERMATLQRVLSQRTRYLTVCLEDIYQSQNASAVLRTCDAFGVQDVHVVERRNSLRINTDVVLGSDKWLGIHRHKGQEPHPSLALMDSLRQQGYRIVATSPHASRQVSLHDFDLTKGRVALWFGTERTGLSPQVMEQADEYLYIPMQGFVESLNISVCAAIVVQVLSQQLRHSGLPWQLEAGEQAEILLEWMKKSVRESGKILSRLVKKE